MRRPLLAWLLALLCALGLAESACADPLVDGRYCGAPVRLADGSIRRRADVLVAFKRQHACPANGNSTGACPGWSMDHVIPLVCGGCDEVSNLQWLPNALKSAAGTLPKDRWEQRVYCTR